MILTPKLSIIFIQIILFSVPQGGVKLYNDLHNHNIFTKNSNNDWFIFSLIRQWIN